MTPYLTTSRRRSLTLSETPCLKPQRGGSPRSALLLPGLAGGVALGLKSRRVRVVSARSAAVGREGRWMLGGRENCPAVADGPAPRGATRDPSQQTVIDQRQIGPRASAVPADLDVSWSFALAP